MIIGVGIDILKISRVKLELSKKILSDEEEKVFNDIELEKRKLEYLAGRFSVKEAIIKAIGNTNYKITMREITILNDNSGKPYIKKPIYNDIKFFISLSHEKDNCVGLCIIESM